MLLQRFADAPREGRFVRSAEFRERSGNIGIEFPFLAAAFCRELRDAIAWRCPSTFKCAPGGQPFGRYRAALLAAPRIGITQRFDQSGF